MLQKHKVLCINNVYQKSTNQIYHFNLQGAPAPMTFHHSSNVLRLA